MRIRSLDLSLRTIEIYRFRYKKVSRYIIDFVVIVALKIIFENKIRIRLSAGDGLPQLPSAFKFYPGGVEAFK